MQLSVIVNNEYTPLQIFLCMFFFSFSIPLYFGSQCLRRVNLAQSSSAEHVLFSNYLPTAFCPTPHDQFTNSMFRPHTRAHTASPKQTAHHAFLMLSALVSSLQQHWLWNTIIMANNHQISKWIRNSRHPFYMCQTVPFFFKLPDLFTLINVS